jgi:hypothetical protein
MTNETQQLAVEWQFEQLFNSFEKFNNGEYTFDEYLKNNLEIRDRAKEMEKAEKLKFATDFFFWWNNHTTSINTDEEVERFYNLTCVGNK